VQHQFALETELFVWLRLVQADAGCRRQAIVERLDNGLTRCNGGAENALAGGISIAIAKRSSSRPRKIARPVTIHPL
jgi:hypothetical protein